MLPHLATTKLQAPPILDYRRIPAKYRLGSNPNDLVTVFRGDNTGISAQRMISKAVGLGDLSSLEDAKRILESGDEGAIDDLIDRHTDGLRPSALISTSYNPEHAQMYAVRKSTTIYRIQIAANRGILDANNIGGGRSQEILVLGWVMPEEFKAVKVDNSGLASELLDKTGFFVRYFPEPESRNREVRDPRNWQLLQF